MKRRDEVTVGVFITITVIVLVLGTLWLARGGLKNGYPLYTRFQWGQNLKQGQPVLLAGVTIGAVRDVKLRPGYLDVMLSVDDQYQIPKGSTATVKAVGIFGDVAVALTPPTPMPTASYAPGDTVPPGPPSADINEIMDRADSIARTVAVLTTALQKEVVEAGTLNDIHKTIASTAALSVQLQQVLAEQNKNATRTMNSFADAATNITQTADRVARLADSAQISGTLVNVRLASENTARLVANLDSTNAAMRKLLAQIQNGNGTLGKLATDTLLYSDMRHLLQRADSLLADIKANPRKYINLKIF
ncbi:MAG TPA: MlaD family protein [Gemmatimonadaceae bacterium]|jgi:phospholipid/cholesterol/gamma-HCH transport system substrate-binding protein